jgi:hypothetical protein
LAQNPIALHGYPVASRFIDKLFMKRGGFAMPSHGVPFLKNESRQ